MAIVSTATPLLTAEDLWLLPDDGMRHELVKGELRTMPPAGFEHGAVEVKITLPLAAYVLQKNLGLVVGAETGFLITQNPDTVRGPDCAFVSQERVDSLGVPKKYFPGPPDLAVEVVSPSDTVDGVEEKVEEWLSAGTRLVWVLHPRRRRVTVYRPNQKPVILTADDNLEGQDVVDGFSVRVGDLFF